MRDSKDTGTDTETDTDADAGTDYTDTDTDTDTDIGTDADTDSLVMLQDMSRFLPEAYYQSEVAGYRSLKTPGTSHR